MPWQDGFGFGPAVSAWWSSRPRFEKIMIISILIGLLILVIILVTRKGTPEPLPVLCITAVCLEEAEYLQEITAPVSNPCDNIYSFSCGNFWLNTPDEYIRLGDVSWRHLHEIAEEPINKDDHKMLKAAKKLYQSCVDDVQIERDHLTTIKAVIEDLGGWPLLEGNQWNEKGFDWQKNIFKLRRMGFSYSIFFVLTIALDPTDIYKFMLQASTDDMFNYQYDFFDWNVTETAVIIGKIFGADDTNELFITDIHDMFEFIRKMRNFQHAHYEENFEVHTLEEYQQKVGLIDWYVFVNRITNPRAWFKAKDRMLFTPPDIMNKWIDEIYKTPKRVLANYMIWKVISDAHTYMPCEIRVGVNNLQRIEPREDFCLAETVGKFLIDPFGIMAIRRYLPEYKRRKVQDLLVNFKLELIEMVKTAEWMEQTDKNFTIDKVKELKLQVGRPFDYFDDKVLDNLEVDWIPNKFNETFMSLSAQARHNYESMVYEQLNVPIAESPYNKTYNATPEYRPKEHTLYIPYTSTEGLYFHYKRPNYLNYGAMGSLVGYQLAKMVTLYSNKWSKVTQEQFEKKMGCMENAMKEYLAQTDDPRWNSTQNLLLTQKAAGEQLAYAVYQKWVKENSQELPLVTTDFSPDQFFWIASATAWCHAYLPFESGNIYYLHDHNFVLKLVDVTIGNNHEYAENFNCPAKSKMNPLNKCKIF